MSLMQIPRKIEYALRAMIYMADRPNGVARGSEIARHEQIPKYYLEKVVRDLMHRGLVHARRGPGGGDQLARAAANISFRDIIEAVEGPITLNVCTDGPSSCALQLTCRNVSGVGKKVSAYFWKYFSDTSLQEISSTRMTTGFPEIPPGSDRCLEYVAPASSLDRCTPSTCSHVRPRRSHDRAMLRCHEP